MSLLLSRAGSQAQATKSSRKQRQYDVDDLKKMLVAVLTGQAQSARSAALSAGLPSAERSLNRYLSVINADENLKGISEEQTLQLQLDFVDELQLKKAGNPDVLLRRLFSDDEYDFFAAALRLHGDMGWPMDFDNVRDMFADAAERKRAVDAWTGQPYVCGMDMVARFVHSRPELRAFKASHVDPLRAKKATYQVYNKSIAL